MSIAFSVNHGCVTALIAVASTVESKLYSGLVNGTLYTTYTLSSLLLANATLSKLGSKWCVTRALPFHQRHRITHNPIIRLVLCHSVQWQSSSKSCDFFLMRIHPRLDVKKTFTMCAHSLFASAWDGRVVLHLQHLTPIDSRPGPQKSCRLISLAFALRNPIATACLMQDHLHRPAVLLRVLGLVSDFVLHKRRHTAHYRRRLHRHRWCWRWAAVDRTGACIVCVHSSVYPSICMHSPFFSLMDPSVRIINVKQRDPSHLL